MQEDELKLKKAKLLVSMIVKMRFLEKDLNKLKTLEEDE